MRAPCSIDGCLSPSKGHGWCNRHLIKWRKYGDPRAGYEKAPSAPGALCTVADCCSPRLALGYCNRHYSAFKRHGDPLGSRPKRADGEGSRRHDGYVILQRDNVQRLEHILVAELALGKPLPAGAVVHHVDENPSNNSPSNLVICPDQAYHMLIHRRMRAFEACGNPNFRKCRHCKQYDDPKNLAGTDRANYHRACDALEARVRRAQQRPASMTTTTTEEATA